LSKRHGATAVGEYRKTGFLPRALDNFLALLGWSPGQDLEVMKLDELISRFTLDRINRKPATFDHEKLGLVQPILIEDGVSSAVERLQRLRAALAEIEVWDEGALELCSLASMTG
jgi:glutamyl/glutaminyl-tRNA synthetase